MKEIGIFIIIAILTTSSAYYSSMMRTGDDGTEQEEEGPLYIPIDPESWHFADAGGNIVLKINMSQLPKGPGKMKLYGMDYPDFTETQAKKHVGKVFPDLAKTTPEKSSYSTYEFKDGNLRLSYYPTTGFSYADRDVDMRMSDTVKVFPDNGSKLELADDYILLEEAAAKAKDFLTENGEIPSTARLEIKDAMTITMRDEITFNVMYSVIYYRYIGDHIVEGGGEKIVVSLNNKGEVMNYLRSWQEDLMDAGTEETIHDSKEALDNITGTGFAGHGKVYSITDVQLGYYNPSFLECVSQLRPIWIFYLDGSTSTALYVDAITLEQY